MAIDDHLTLKGEFTHWKKESLQKNIEHGIIRWLKWAFLEVYGYMNVTRSPATTFVEGTTPLYQLVRTKDENKTDGQVYQAFAQDWVWETGLAQGGTPQAAEIYVNGVLRASTDVGYEHYVDYPRGRVVFDAARVATDDVEANFAFRTPSFVPAALPWFQELMFDMFRVDRDDFLNAFSGGAWSQLAETRAQLPVVGIELVSRGVSAPYELGNGILKWRFQDVLFHIFADNDTDAGLIADKLEAQDDKVIYLLDVDAMVADAGYPHDLNYRGELVSSPTTYPTLIGNFPWVKAQLRGTSIQRMAAINGWLHRRVVRTTLVAIA